MFKNALTLSILAAGTLAAQQPATPPAAAAPWAVPAGWTIMTDGGAAMAETKFQTMGPGFHVTSGPAAIYFRAGDVAKGNYTVKATFGQRVRPSMGHPEAYGVFIGGSDLTDPAKQQYMYLVVRDDGQFYIAHRAGKDVHKINGEWAPNDAVVKANDKGAASNEVAIQVTADGVNMMVNGKTVKAFTKNDLRGFVTDGQYGFRVNHMLNVHIGNFGMSQ